MQQSINPRSDRLKRLVVEEPPPVSQPVELAQQVVEARVHLHHLGLDQQLRLHQGLIQHPFLFEVTLQQPQRRARECAVLVESQVDEQWHDLHAVHV